MDLGRCGFRPPLPGYHRAQGQPQPCVLQVSILGAGSSILLTGDIDTGVEDELVAAQPEWPASTILVAGHHGSDTSTGNAFLETVAPRFVLYAVGYANRFSLPAAAVCERVAAQGADQLDTGRVLNKSNAF